MTGRNLTIILILITTLIVTTVAAALYSASLRIPSTGVTKTVGIQCSESFINWETPSPGDIVNRTVDITNNGTVQMTVYLTTENWQPVNASMYLNCTWDLEGFTLQPNETHSAIISLYVSPEITGITTFSFDIILTGVEKL